jgi:hypothetical protein
MQWRGRGGAHPIITVGIPTGTIAPQPAASPTRSAGLPPKNTVELPIVNGVDGTWDGGGIAHACMSPSTAAGIPPMRTVATPGPTTAPP